MNKFKGFIKLSQEQYDTLKEQGSIEIKGKTFTYDPDNTIYIVKGESVQFTQEDQTKVNTIDISGDGSKFLSDDGVYKEIENRTEALSGTAENPLNLKTLELGKLYLISGIFSKYQNSTIDVGITRQVLMRVNFIRNDIKEKEIVIYGMHIDSSGYAFSNDYVCEYTIDSDTGYSKGYYDNYTMISYLNGKSPGTTSLYAPTSSGNVGQVLQSNGSGNAPTWITPNIDVVKTDTSTISEIYNLLQTKFNENKSISFTLKYIGHILGASVPSYGYDPNSMEMEPYNINLQLLNDTQRTYLPCKVIGISNSRVQCTFETIDAVGSFEIAEDNIYGLSLNYEHVVSEKYTIGCDFNGLVLSSNDRNYGLDIISY